MEKRLAQQGQLVQIWHAVTQAPQHGVHLVLQLRIRDRYGRRSVCYDPAQHFLNDCFLRCQILRTFFQ